MSQEKSMVCPVCQGKKVVKGTCECDAEWRGSQLGDAWEECRCSPEEKCYACKGTGLIEVDEKKCSLK